MRRVLLAAALPLAVTAGSLFLAGCPSQGAATPTAATSTPTRLATPRLLTPTAAAIHTPSLGATPAASTPSSVAGQQLFQTNCSACHGANGAGGITIGDTTSADLRQAALQPKYKNDNTLLRRAILDGKNESGGNLSPAMPRWRGQLTEQQVDIIIAFLKTLR